MLAEQTLELVDLNSYITQSIEADCKSFDCGNAEINEYLTDFSTRPYGNQKSRVILAIKNNTIVGYVSFSISDIRLDQTRFSDASTTEAFPVLKIDALGVDKNYKGNKYGAKLVVYVLRLALSMEYFVTFLGIYLNALVDKVEYYEGFGFDYLDVNEKIKYSNGINNGQTIKMILNMTTLNNVGIPPFEIFYYDEKRAD